MNTTAKGGDPLFFRLDVNSLAILSRLRYSEFKVYSYLRASDWFCNKTQDLDFAELLAVCAINKTAAYTALARLNELGLIDWTHVRSNVRVKPLSSEENFSGTAESIPVQRNQFRSSGTDSAPAENRHLKVAPSRRFKDVRSLDQLEGKEEIKKEHDFSTDADYIQWINQGINSLPKPPQGHFRDRMLQKAIEDPENQELYQSKKKRKRPIIKALEPIPSFPTNGEFQQQQQQQRLETLQHLWEKGERSRVKATINSNPEWGLVLGEYGPAAGGPGEG